MAVFNAETAEPANIELRAPVGGRQQEVLTPEALHFLSALHRRFEDQRQRLSKLRESRQLRFATMASPGFPEETQHIRDGDWTVSPLPAELAGVTIAVSGPADRKALLEGLRSGVAVYIADLSDATVHGWAAIIDAQINLLDRWDGRLEATDAQSGKTARLDDAAAALMLRPRGWHLDEPNLCIDSAPISASLFDFGLYAFHGTFKAMATGSSAYFALPSIESSQEARLWDDVLRYAQEQLAVPQGTLRAMPALETLTAAFEIDEILYEMRDHALGFYLGAANLGSSYIGMLRADPSRVLPDRAAVSASTPIFSTASTRLMVQDLQTPRGQGAIGRQSDALCRQWSRQRTAPNAWRRSNRLRLRRSGLDGIVLIPEPFALRAALNGGNNPIDAADLNPAAKEGAIEAADLLRVPDGNLTEVGIRASIRLCIGYLEGWLRGRGSAVIDGRTFTAADADLARAHIWQQLRHAARLDDGRVVDPGLVSVLIEDELFVIRNAVGIEAFGRGRYADAQKLLRSLVSAPDFVPHLTRAISAHSD
jgi:malate synthase